MDDHSLDHHHRWVYPSVFPNLAYRTLGLSPACHLCHGLVCDDGQSALFDCSWKPTATPLMGDDWGIYLRCRRISALSIVPTNVYFGAIGGFEPLFPAAFFYGIVFTESLQVIGFGMAVIMAVIKAKDTDQHAIWMLSTLFFGLMPGWGRLVMFPMLMTGGKVPWLDVQTCINIGVIVFVLVVLYVGYRLQKLKHPAIILSIICVILMAFSISLGEQSWYQELVTRIMKPTVPWNL